MFNQTGRSSAKPSRSPWSDCAHTLCGRLSVAHVRHVSLSQRFLVESFIAPFAPDGRIQARSDDSKTFFGNGGLARLARKAVFEASTA